MFDHNEYVTGWLIYGGCTAVFWLAWWFITARVGFTELRQLLRLIAVVGLIVPWHADVDSIYLAPAWVIAVTEGIFDGPAAFWRAGTPLLFALALMLVVVTLLRLVTFFASGRKANY